jgi:hypothetical protein
VTTEGIHRETAQSIASPSTVKHTETQYTTRTAIQSKGSMTVGKPKSAGCAAAASCRRGRNPPNAGERPKLAQYPTDCGNLDIG